MRRAKPGFSCCQVPSSSGVCRSRRSAWAEPSSRGVSQSGKVLVRNRWSPLAGIVIMLAAIPELLFCLGFLVFALLPAEWLLERVHSCGMVRPRTGADGALWRASIARIG